MALQAAGDDGAEAIGAGGAMNRRAVRAGAEAFAKQRQGIAHIEARGDFARLPAGRALLPQMKERRRFTSLIETEFAVCSTRD